MLYQVVISLAHIYGDISDFLIANIRAAEDVAARAEAELRDAQEQLSTLRLSLDAAEAAATEAQDALAQQRSRADAAVSDKTALAAQQAVLEATTAKTIRERDAARGEAAAAKKQAAALDTSVRALNKKLELYKALDGLSVQEFTAMTTAAAKNLNSLQSLFGQIATEDEKLSQQQAADAHSVGQAVAEAKAAAEADAEAAGAAALAVTMPSAARIGIPRVG